MIQTGYYNYVKDILVPKNTFNVVVESSRKNGNVIFIIKSYGLLMVCVYMYLHVFTCIYMCLHVFTCIPYMG